MASNLNRYKSGEKHNMVTLLGLYEKNIGGNLWKARCDCDSIIVVLARDVRTGHTKSCGCMKAQWVRESRTTHGMESTKEYSSWLKMRGRCLNPNDKKFPRYGGRGITICKEWDKFEQFYRDMGPRPENTTLDRRNNDGNYEASNCRWASPLVQSNNRNYNHNVVLCGEKLSCTQASTKLGVYPTSIFQRAKDFRESYQQACDHFARKQNLKIIVSCRSMVEQTIQRIAA